MTTLCPPTPQLRYAHAMRNWLYVICLMILLMVVVGGATRLTGSGLSITEWKPIHGVIPPLSAAQWQEEFAKYREIPQYKLINAGMSLAEFKGIFWWEWGHRFLGRFVGLVFFCGVLFFWLKGAVPRWLKPHLIIAFCAGGLQGAVGWWMVASGLVERVEVSQYRLAVHLLMACALYCYVFYLAQRVHYAVIKSTAGQAGHRANWSLMCGWGFVGLCFVQILLGALVAGLNAGMAFNTWPLMDGALIPQGLYVLDPWWLGHFESIKLVQLQHRLGGYLLFIASALLWWGLVRSDAPRSVLRAALCLWGAVSLQAVLGIWALVSVAALDKALAHQAMAMVVLALAMQLVVLLKFQGQIGERAGEAVSPVAI
ncbi:COX15/CtaA family protein [Polycladidibacter stylochi]|uniref:COX15/CtaA family protein n=1 Tax=Polycladidibacter stylochi TaxID=1807766 RepID=UPI00082F94AF|nr:COX15/CtaA family protein [Pseudovibrio stylochi]